MKRQVSSRIPEKQPRFLHLGHLPRSVPRGCGCFVAPSGLRKPEIRRNPQQPEILRDEKRGFRWANLIKFGNLCKQNYLGFLLVQGEKS